MWRLSLPRVPLMWRPTQASWSSSCIQPLSMRDYEIMNFGCIRNAIHGFKICHSKSRRLSFKFSSRKRSFHVVLKMLVPEKTTHFLSSPEIFLENLQCKLDQQNYHLLQDILETPVISQWDLDQLHKKVVKFIIKQSHLGDPDDQCVFQECAG